jgi:hypothetical protein
MKNEKAIISAKDYGSNKNLTDELTKPIQRRIDMTNHKPNTIKFQYHCSFCACELAEDGLRFNGVGACPSCDDLAEVWVNSLREHAANYFNDLGVKR